MTQQTFDPKHMTELAEKFGGIPSDVSHLGTLIDTNGSGFIFPLTLGEISRRTRRAYDLPFNSAWEVKGLLKDKGVAVVGSGPSMIDDLDKIIEAQKNGALVVALNTAHDHLLDLGVKPDMAVLIETQNKAKDYIHPVKECAYVLGSTLDDETVEVFMPFADFVLQFHALHSLQHRMFVRDMNRRKKEKMIPGIGGGSTVGLRFFDFSLAIMETKYHLFFGMDSSGSTEGGMHSRAKPLGKAAANFSAQLGFSATKTKFKRKYQTTRQMARQAAEFWVLLEGRQHMVAAKRLHEFAVAFYGRGYLPDWAATLGYHVDSDKIRAELEAEGTEDAQEFNTVKKVAPPQLKLDERFINVSFEEAGPSQPLRLAAGPQDQITARGESTDAGPVIVVERLPADDDQRVGEPEAGAAPERT